MEVAVAGRKMTSNSKYFPSDAVEDYDSPGDPSETSDPSESVSKPCSACGKTKKLKEFYRNSATKDGHFGICKECVSNREKARRRGPVEAVETVAVAVSPTLSCVHFWICDDVLIEVEWPDFFKDRERFSTGSGKMYHVCKHCKSVKIVEQAYSLTPRQQKALAKSTSLEYPQAAQVAEDQADLVTGEIGGIENVRTDWPGLPDILNPAVVELEVSMQVVASRDGKGPEAEAGDQAVASGTGGDSVAAVLEDASIGPPVGAEEESWAESYQKLKGEFYDLGRHARDLEWQLRQANVRARVAELDLEIYKLQQERARLTDHDLVP